MRRDVSLLRSEGHVSASAYPVWQLQLEVLLAVQRINVSHATQATLTKSAIDAALCKEALQSFNQTIKRLNPELN